MQHKVHAMNMLLHMLPNYCECLCQYTSFGFWSRPPSKHQNLQCQSNGLILAAASLSLLALTLLLYACVLYILLLLLRLLLLSC